MRMKLLRTGAAVIGLLAALTAAVPAAQAAVPAAGTTYAISVKNSGMCLDVIGGAVENGALVQQWDCWNGAMQQWALRASGSGAYALVNVATGKCLDIPYGTAEMFVQAQQWSCSGGLMQQWRLVSSGSGTYQLVNVQSGLCLANKDAGKAAGVAVVQETCTANSNKQWLFTPAAGGRAWSNSPDGFAGAAGTTGGAGGQTVTATTYADLVRYASAAAPYTIRVDRAITATPYGTEIKVASNKTIIGVGTAGQIVNGGFNLSAVSNVIIRNLTIRDTRMASDDPDDKDFDYDGIQMDTARNVWIDHNTITRMNDGLIDSRKDTTNLTVSWNVLAENNKAFGIGWTDNTTARITIHHNWIHHNNQRNPSTDNVAYAHLYNNHMQAITGYGNYARGNTKMVIENTYYDGVKDPYYRDDTAQLRQSGSIVVNSTGQRETGGTAFDPRSYYAYTLDAAADVPALLRTYSGPQGTIGL
ncbi:RICIN domain-containing protein [Saccharothrix sp. 6-C]|uniref:RICIN domain-containing protein n=1 Tax=Saccharothrix sp. 6-C TaxID=2781735 RepID=UPI0019179034|nr:RICIN domain-containing protein [Saccharothrix sp. 6-C]QQQ74062.1 RICIN domain-containing protein [Saccharothrix sp. 6-C]